MAGGGLAPSGGKEFEAKITPIVIISCIMAATGGLMFGYDVGVSGHYIYILLLSFSLSSLYILTNMTDSENNLINSAYNLFIFCTVLLHVFYMYMYAVITRMFYVDIYKSKVMLTCLKIENMQVV